MAFDIDIAVQLGKLVNVAYGIPPQPVPVDLSKITLGDANLTLLNVIYGDDPWDSRDGYVAYGLLVKTNSDPCDLMVILRGTEDLWGWFKNVECWRVPCPIPGAPTGAETEEGFTTLYNTLRAAPIAGAVGINQTIKGWMSPPTPLPVANIYVCGHSQGGALGTLVALDLAAEKIWANPILYTFASPAVGESSFAAWFDQLVPNAYRIANAPDIVPTVPPSVFGYRHVDELYPVNSGAMTNPSIVCHHSLNTYLHLLDPVNCPIGTACAPA